MRKGNADILLLDTKSRKVTPFLNSEAWEVFSEISPDGKWMAYASLESGTREVWIRPFPGPGGRWQISRNGGGEPLWSKDGRQLFYRTLSGQVWIVDIRMEGGFSASKPRLLFAGNFAQLAGTRNWDLWPDGQGFLMVKAEEKKTAPVTEMTLVQNWFKELESLAPAR